MIGSNKTGIKYSMNAYNNSSTWCSSAFRYCKQYPLSPKGRFPVNHPDKRLHFFNSPYLSPRGWSNVIPPSSKVLGIRRGNVLVLMLQIVRAR
jgi:hypothetical protein